jgi:hypothetical protein
MTSDERRRVVAGALGFGRDLGPHDGRSRLDVTSFFHGGRLRLIFILDRRTPESDRERWRNIVRAANIAAAVVDRSSVVPT